MTFASILDILLTNFGNELVWCVIDEYHADYGAQDVLSGPYSYRAACDHKMDTETRQPGRKARIVFDLMAVSS